MQKNGYEAVVFVGPSALGKTYAAESLMQQFPHDFEQAKVHTTRPPRHEDEGSVDRTFVDVSNFQAMIESGEFLVHGEFGGNLYGFTESALIPDEKHILVNAWPALIPKLARLVPRPVFVGLQAPAEWQTLLTDRMRKRGDSQETINKRLDLIENDIKLTNQHEALISQSGKLFIVEGDQTIPELVIPWICQKLGLPDPK